MLIKQLRFDSTTIVPADLAPLQAIAPQLLLVFASVQHFEAGVFTDALRAALPDAIWMGCSTAGEISASGVSDASAVFTAIHFDHPDIRVASARLPDMASSQLVGAKLGKALQAADLNGVLVLGQGVQINGSALIAGIAAEVGDEVMISGGLAGDAGRFTRSYVLGNAGSCDQSVVALGIYGRHLHLSHGSYGGWQAFGPLRLITRFAGNVLYELDGKPALELYRKYLGEYADKLPGSGLLFPFSMMTADAQDIGIIRTILGIDAEAGSLILAGDLIEGGYLRLMHASSDRLIDGAEAAAELSCAGQSKDSSGLALLVSCVGRKLVMGGRTEEEVEAVSRVLGPGAVLAGFYSNGEIGPGPDSRASQLHNQTMTITCLCED
jgi:hypothetical protein